jgi:phage shock protein PspC (stress-responsive transcriptional regulator)
MNDEERRPGDEESRDEPAEESAETRPMEGDERAPKRLLRSRDDRVIAGVAGGLGRYFNVDPLIFRIGFGVSIFLGGLGLLAYLALWIAVPTRDDDGIRPAPIERSRALAVAVGIGAVILVLSVFDGGPFWSDWGWTLLCMTVLAGAGVAAYAFLRGRDRSRPLRGGRLVAAVALAVTAAIGLVVLAVLSAWATAEGVGEIAVGALLLIALGMVVGALTGRGTRARWLIVPAIAIAVPLGVVAAADIELEGGYGKRHYEPLSVSTLPADGYELAVGQLLVDLRQLDWERDRVVDLDLDLGIGEAVVAVPESVCVAADAHVGAGAIEATGEEVDGFDVDEEAGQGSTQLPRLNLDGNVDAGVLRVLADDDVDLDDDDREWFDDGRRLGDAAEAEACA